MIKRTLVLSFALILSACDTISSDQLAGPESNLRPGQASASRTTSGPIRRSYMVHFEESTGRSSVVATFRPAGSWFTTVRLVPPSEFRVNGRRVDAFEPLSQANSIASGLFFPILGPFLFLMSGTSYIELLGQFGAEQPVKVEWIDPAGRWFKDELTVHGFRFRAPERLAAGQSLRIEIDDSSDGGAEYQATLSQINMDHGMDSKFARGSTRWRKHISISAAELAALGAGPAELKVTKVVKVRLYGPGRETASVVYEARPVRVEVIR